MRIMTKTAMAALVLVAGCATAKPTPELVRARMAYARVSSGSAAQTVPDEVHKAKVTLDTAERSFTADPESSNARDLAYVSERTSQLAEAKGNIANSGKDLAAADHQFKRTLSDQKDQATSDAARSEAQRKDEASQHVVAMTDAQAKIDAETKARLAAEAQSKVLLADLALLGQLREEARGTVITLSGDVVFVSGQAGILPSAQSRLDKLADTLKRGNNHVIIEGHTDSRGSASMNQDLSSRRAGSVRDYLAGRGVVGERMQVAGFGKTRPIADNNSPEGRAMNRRVEIIVEGVRTAQK
jgi:outer membrane protein OmpA-like peptidoglycan-associated protein